MILYELVCVCRCDRLSIRPAALSSARLPVCLSICPSILPFGIKQVRPIRGAERIESTPEPMEKDRRAKRHLNWHSQSHSPALLFSGTLTLQPSYSPILSLSDTFTLQHSHFLTLSLYDNFTRRHSPSSTLSLSSTLTF